MAVDEQINQLSRQLSKNSLGPVDAVSSELAARLGSAFGAVVSSLQQAAYERPLITLLLSAQAGYLIARLGRPYARN